MTYLTLQHPDTEEIITVARNEGAEIDLDAIFMTGWNVLGEHEDPPAKGAEWTGTTWEVPIALLKQRLREEINELRDFHQDMMCNTPIGVVQCDEKSKLRIDGLVNMATLSKIEQQQWLAAKAAAEAAGDPVPVQPQVFGVNFTRMDNQRIPLDANGMIGVGITVGKFIIHCHDHASALKVQLDAATTVEELEAIDILNGWPS